MPCERRASWAAKAGSSSTAARRLKLGEAAIGQLYNRAGFAGRHVPHDWRATFSTVLNELFPTERAVIDQALAHVPKDKVEAAYNRAGHLARRRDLFCAWGALLMDVAAPAETLLAP